MKVVVALGGDPASQDIAKIFEESTIMRSKIQPGCIVLRIIDGSQEFSDFNNFWTIHGTPMIFFMNGKGEMVRDPLAGAVTEAQILRALVTIKNEAVSLKKKYEFSKELSHGGGVFNAYVSLDAFSFSPRNFSTTRRKCAN